MQHLRRDAHIRCEEYEVRGHVGAHHAHALGNAAYAANLSAELELHGHALGDGVRRHYGQFCVQAVVAEACEELIHAVRYGLYVQLEAYDACGRHDDILLRYPALCGNQGAHLIGHLYAVIIACVGVAAVANHRLRAPVRYMLLGDDHRRSLHKVLREDPGRRCRHAAHYERQVFLLLVLAQPAMYSGCREPLRRAYAAVHFNNFETHISLLSLLPFGLSFIYLQSRPLPGNRFPQAYGSEKLCLFHAIRPFLTLPCNKAVYALAWHCPVRQYPPRLCRPAQALWSRPGPA